MAHWVGKELPECEHKKTPVAIEYFPGADFLPDGSGGDLITVERVPQADVYNCVPVKYVDRNTSATDQSAAYQTQVEHHEAPAPVEAAQPERVPVPLARTGVETHHLT